MEKRGEFRLRLKTRKDVQDKRNTVCGVFQGDVVWGDCLP